jgi:hypothetical protein
MIAKATIFAAAATIFIHLLTHALRRGRFLAATLLAVLFAFPFNFHNLMWAFQSQFDFFLLSVALGWLALQKDRPVAALVIAGLALFTLGGGPILAASYVPFGVWAWVDQHWSLRKAGVFLGAALAVMAVGVSLRGDHAAPLASRPEQARAVTALLAWPHSSLVSLVDRLPDTQRLIPRPLLNFPSADHSWLMRTADWMHAHPAVVTVLNGLFALVVLAPIIAVSVLVVRRRIRGPAVWGALGLAGFATLMQIATGIARAQEVGIPVRYVDVVALLSFSALACAFVLWEQAPVRRSFVGAWAVLMIPACLAIMVGTMATVRNRRPQLWLENVRSYFPGHDHAHFHAVIAKDPEWSLPFISRDIEDLMAMLDDPAYEAIVPRSVTAPEEPPHAVARAASAVGEAGLWIVLAGVGAGAWVVFRPRRRMRIAVSGNAVPST